MSDLIEFQQSRTSRNQQTNRQLNRRNVFDQIVFSQDAQQFEVAVQRRPGREGHKGRVQDQIQVTKDAGHLEKIRPRVTFVQAAQHLVIQRFDGAGHEEATRIAQGREVPLVFQQVLDLEDRKSTRLNSSHQIISYAV